MRTVARLCRAELQSDRLVKNSVALDGTIDANLGMAVSITGQVSSGSVDLFEIGIPGLVPRVGTVPETSFSRGGTPSAETTRIVS